MQNIVIKTEIIRALYQLVGSPREVESYDFGLDNAIKNRNLYEKLTKKKSKSFVKELQSDIGMWSFPTEFAVLDDDKKKVLYYVQYKIANIVGIKSVTQIKVWRSFGFGKIQKGFASEVFFDYILPKADMIVTDKLQTPEGKRFWGDRIADALEKGLNVYAIDTDNKTTVLIDDLEETQKYWGKPKKYQNLLIGITSLTL